MDEFEEAVLYSYNPNVPNDVKAKAAEYCNNVRNSREGWLYCLDKFYKTTRVEVKFFCLNVLLELIQHRYLTLTVEERTQLKSGLWRYLTDVVTTGQEQNSVKNKYAHVLALLFRAEYPQSWPTFFADLLALLRLGPVMIDIFLRILKTIDEDVICRDVQRSTTEAAQTSQIKDFMRGQAIKDIVAAWYNILVAYERSAPDLCNECLDNVKRYISWIDINLIVNDTFLPLFFKFLTVKELREKSCECIFEIVSKGMDPLTKMALISKLKLTSVFAQASVDSDVDYLDKVANIVNTMGVELVSANEKVNSLAAEQKATPEMIATAKALLEETLGLLFRFMANEDDDVSATVFTFAGSYLNMIKNQSNLSQQQMEHLNLFLQIIRSKLKYDESFDINKKGEENAEIKEFRQELLNLYKTIVRISPQMVAQFVHATVSAAIANFDKISFSDIEVSLTLFYTMGEESLKNMEPYYAQMINLLASSNLSTYPHPAVALVYFDTLVRYSKYFPPDPEVLKNILISFLDGRGIRHPHATVRSRVCYLFQRIAKVQVAQLVPFLSSIVNSVKEFLVISPEVQKVFSFEDQLNLFEAVSSLIAALPAPADQRQYLEEIVSPLLRQGLAIIQNQLFKTDTPDKPIYTTLLVQTVVAVGTFSKGFNANAAESKLIFKESLNFVLAVFQVLSGNEEVRVKVIFFMHRMIECLGEEVLSSIPAVVSQLLATSNLKDLMELIRLLNQLMAKFKEKMLPVMDPILVKLIERIFKIVAELSQQNTTANGTEAISDFQRDIIELQKTYYSMIHSIVAYNLISVLNSPTNLPLLTQILKTIVEGCANLTDINGVKVCYQIFKKLIENWIQPDPANNFNTYILSEVMPVLLKQPFRRDFDLADAASNQVVQEVIQIQQVLYAKLGKHYSDVLRTFLAQSLQCPPEIVEQYIQNVESGNAKQFKTFFAALAASYKKSAS